MPTAPAWAAASIDAVEVRRQTRGVRFQRQREALGCAVGVVGQIHAALLAVEQGRSDRKITLRGILLSHALDVSSDAEDFLDHDDRTLGGIPRALPT